MNNRTLLYIFLAILIVFVGAKLLRKDRRASFDPVLSAVDTAKVDRIKFISAGQESEEFELVKDGSGWKAVQGDRQVPASITNVSTVLGQLSSLRAKRIVTKDAARYADYEITDDMATQLIAYEGKKELAHLILGGFRFDQATRSASAFVRKGKGDEVYEVDGFVIMSLKQNFDQYRDKSLMKAAVEDLNHLEWSNVSGRKEVLIKEDNDWLYAGMEEVDSADFASYLRTVSNARGSEFHDGSIPQSTSIIEQLKVSGNNLVEPVVISAYINTDSLKPFLIHSSINPDAYFLSDSSGIYKMIFTDLKQFLPVGQ